VNKRAGGDRESVTARYGPDRFDAAARQARGPQRLESGGFAAHNCGVVRQLPKEKVMTAPAFALLMAIQTSSMPAALPSSPSIWSPPRSTPVQATFLPATSASEENAGGLAVQVRRQITAELRSGQISGAQARAFRRDLEAIDGGAWGIGESDVQRMHAVSSLEALSSLIYAAGSAITPK
jgi:hypothetical protein